MAQAQWRDKVPFGTQLHRCSFTPFCIFRHLLGPLFTLFNTQRFFLLIWGIHTCLTHLFSKKEIITCITTFKKKKREKWTKLRFFKTMDSCPKLGAFGHALSPLYGTSQNMRIFLEESSGTNFQTRGIRLCLIQVSTNSTRIGQDKFKLVLQDLLK